MALRMPPMEFDAGAIPPSDAPDAPVDLDALDAPDAPDTPDATALAGRHLVLVGLMGVGKSTVGPLVADALGRRFIDLDAEVERRAGRTVRELVTIDGEPEFRRLEAETMAELVAAPNPVVLATGGGAVLDAHSRQLMRDRPLVVWLRASVDTLVDRVGGGDAGLRPLLDDGPVEALTRLAGERDDLYREVADVEVDTTLDDANGVAASVLTAVGERRLLLAGEQDS